MRARGSGAATCCARRCLPLLRTRGKLTAGASARRALRAEGGEGRRRTLLPPGRMAAARSQSSDSSANALATCSCASFSASAIACARAAAATPALGEHKGARTAAIARAAECDRCTTTTGRRFVRRRKRGGRGRRFGTHRVGCVRQRCAEDAGGREERRRGKAYCRRPCAAAGPRSGPCACCGGRWCGMEAAERRARARQRCVPRCARRCQHAEATRIHAGARPAPEAAHGAQKATDTSTTSRAALPMCRQSKCEILRDAIVAQILIPYDRLGYQPSATTTMRARASVPIG